MINAVERWHEVVSSGDPAMLDSILAEDCVFYSPVVHTPQEGKAITTLYLTGAMHVLNQDFRYTKEVVTPTHAVLEFVCVIDGISINGVDIMSFDGEGKIIEFKVMLRPLKAVNMVHAKMQSMLEQLSA